MSSNPCNYIYYGGGDH